MDSLRNKILLIITVIAVLSWIPLLIVAIYISDLRLDIKLFGAALVSFVGMLIWVMKED